jgi:hypothetical protein
MHSVLVTVWSALPVVGTHKPALPRAVGYFVHSLDSYEMLALPWPCTQVFDYPTLSAIVGYLDTTLAAQQPELQQPDAAAQEAAAAAAPRVPPKAPPTVAYAEQGGVIWVSAVHSRFPDPPATAAVGVVPGGSLLHDVISVVPLERYDVEVQLTQDIPARFGGFLPAVQVRSWAGVFTRFLW